MHEKLENRANRPNLHTVAIPEELKGIYRQETIRNEK